MSGVSKMTADKNHRILLELVAQPGNDMCADCKAKAPRWASHNLGIFICVRCASVHRKMGTHISKVKSVTLDSWTKDQVEHMKKNGNIKSNEYYNPDEKRNPLPANFEESERDSELEKYIRAKYEYKKFRSLSARATEQLGPSRSLSRQNNNNLPPPARSHTAPIRTATPPRATPPPMPSTASTAAIAAPGMDGRSFSSSIPSSSSGSNPVMIAGSRTSSFNPFPMTGGSNAYNPQAQLQMQRPSLPAHHQASLTSSTFDDLLGLQQPSAPSSLPLQYQPTTSFSAAPPTQFSSLTPQFTSSSSSSTNPFPINSQPTGQPQSFNLSPTPSFGTTNPYKSFSSSTSSSSGYGGLSSFSPSLNPQATGSPSLSSPSPFNPLRSATLPVPGVGFSQGQGYANSPYGMGQTPPLSASAPMGMMAPGSSPGAFSGASPGLGGSQPTPPLSSSSGPFGMQPSTSAPPYSQPFGAAQQQNGNGSAVGAPQFFSPMPPSHQQQQAFQQQQPGMQGYGQQGGNSMYAQQAANVFQGMMGGGGGGTNPFAR